MKSISFVVWATIPSVVSSFTSFDSSKKNAVSSLKMASDIAPKKYSKSIPFLERPAALDGETYPGDVGFDPLGLAQDDKWLFNFREAEIKHARLAMLAAAGWPLSELFDEKIASSLDLPVMLNSDGRVPSLLNGGLEKISSIYWIACLGLAAAADAYGLLKVDNKDYTPGDLGFDPLNIKKNDNVRKWVATAEIKNGRLAMLAVTAYAFLEFFHGTPVVKDYPFLFQSLDNTLNSVRSGNGIN